MMNIKTVLLKFRSFFMFGFILRHAPTCFQTDLYDFPLSFNLLSLPPLLTDVYNINKCIECLRCTVDRFKIINPFNIYQLFKVV